MSSSLRVWPGSTVTEHIWGDAPLPTQTRVNTPNVERGPDPIGAEIARLFGLPPLTQRFTLRCDVGRPPYVICEYQPSGADIQAVGLGANSLELIRAEYELVLRNTTESEAGA